ncbi:hypothetical protein [Sphaerimonospora mesophila]|uniref:hypothetical protein n=1 Tax=Sphaerimonospora mesophila TaxID=37483 RepID=UPI0006E2D900
MNCAWWLPGTPRIPRGPKLVAMMEYFHPVFFSNAVRLALCLLEGLTRRTSRRTFQSAAGVDAGQLGDAGVGVHGAVLA